MANKKILVVDDEPDIIKMIDVRLRANNYDVFTASDGAEGLEKVKRDKPDLILLDVMMPEVDGFQLFKMIRRDPLTAKIPIIMLTARGAMKDTFEALGVEDFISKPFESEILLLKINQIFANSALVLSDDSYVVEKISKGLRGVNYEITIVPDEEGMSDKGRENKYKIIVAHLRFVKKEPAVFALNIRMMREKNPQVVIYFDDAVKSKDQEAATKLSALKDSWLKAGVQHFFDTRAADRSFTDFVKTITT